MAKFMRGRSLSKKFKVKRKFKEDIEPEEIFLDSKRLKESPEAEREKLEKPIKEKVLKLFFIFTAVLLVLLFVKTFHLQIIKGDYWRNLADENRIRSYPIKALRGIIYDKNKIPLAINIPKLDLVVVPADLAGEDNFDEIISKLTELLIEEDPPRLASRREAGIKEKVKDNICLTYPIVIEEDIDRERALLLEAKYADIPSISIRKDSWRQYESPYFSHILGYLGKINRDELSKEDYFLDDYIGREGVERFYEDLLRGEYGKELVEIDNVGRIQKVLATKEAITGQDLILSIDTDLQKKLYQSLRGMLNGLYTSRGAAIALNPQNGKILALVSFPGFDNNDIVKALSSPNQPLFNRAIAGIYPPGSTIKPLIASGILQEGLISPDKSFYCQGQVTLFDKYNPNVFWTFHDWKTHGTVNMYKAIAESCNTYFYTYSGGYKDIEGLGIERIGKYLKLFGWNEILGIDLPGEKTGLIPNSEWKEKAREEEWYIGDTYNVSIGQGDVSATPLQLAIATAAVANGGRVFEPQLLENKLPKTLKQDFIDEDFLEAVRRGMREAVIYGSAKYLYDLPVKAAGKTGTAQVSKTKAPHSWFTVFAPYENPEIVLTVLVENGGEGSATAVPVAKEVLTWYFNQLLLKE